MFKCQTCKSNYLSSKCSYSTASRYQTKKLPNPKKLPLILRCGHTFCESCLNKLKEKIPRKIDVNSPRCVDLNLEYKFKLPCPNSDCQVITLVRNGLNELPVNNYILSYVESDKDAVMSKILDGIIAGASGDDHVMNKPERRFQKEESKSDVAKHCKIHQRIIEYFCEDDNSFICSRCYIMGDHKNHSITSLEDKNKPILGDLETGLVTVKTVLAQLNMLDKKSSFAIADLKPKLMSLMRSINQSFMNAHTLLQAREAEMIDRVSTTFKTCILSFEDKKKESLQCMWDLKMLVEDGGHLLENTGVIIDGNDIVERMKLASQIPCILPKRMEVNSIHWQEKQLTELTDAIKSFGDINGSVDALYLRTLNEAGDEIEDDDQISIISENSESYPSTDLQSFSSQTSVDVIIESDSENGSEISANSKSKRNSQSEMSVPEFQEKIVVPKLKGPPQQVCVTHINSPCDFFIQIDANKAKFSALAHNIDSWCRRSSSLKYVPHLVERGMLILARFGMDKLWYRAQVLNMIETDVDGKQQLKVKVKYIDFGNEEAVSWQDIRLMQKRFLGYPEFSVRCCLHDIAPFDKNKSWELKDIERFLTMTNNKMLLMNVISISGNVHFVDLIGTPTENVSCDGFASIRDMLVFLENASFCAETPSSKSTLVMPVSKKLSFFKPAPLNPGETIAINVTEALSPSDIYVIMTGEVSNYYVHLQEEMKKTYTEDTGKLYLVHWPREEMLCAVEGKDGKWFRGCVLQVDTHKKITVFLADVGRTVVVPCVKMRKLLSDFVKLPSQAIHCTLKDVSPMDDDGSSWSKEAKTWCRAKLTGNHGSARIVRWGNPTEIVLLLEDGSSSSSQTINYQIVKHGLAKSRGLASLPLCEEVRQQIPDPSPEAIEIFRKAIPQSPKRNNSSSSGKNSPMSPSTRKSTPTKKLRSPKLPTSSSSPSKEMPSKARRQLSSTEFEKCQEADSTKVSFNKTESKAVESKLQRNNDSNANQGSNPAYVEITICRYNTPGHFYIRMQENEIMLSDLMDDLQETYRDSEPVKKEDWLLDGCCAVRNPDDNKWYRGKIKALHSESDVEVDFLDYGYEKRVSCGEMRVLDHQLGLRLHWAAVRCHLANLISTGSSNPQIWTRTAIEFMADQVKDKKLFLQTEGEPMDQSLPVDIIIEEEIPPTAFDPAQHSHHSLCKVIQEHGLAMENKATASKSSTSSGSRNIPENEIYPKTSPKPDAFLNTMEEELSKDSGNASGSPHALKEMESPGSVNGVNSPSQSQDDTLVGDDAGNEVEVEEALSFNIPPYPPPLFGSEVEVLPTFVDYSGVIFAQPIAWENAIVHITNELQRLYKGSKAPHVIWKVGQSCVAKFVDDNLWYRGIIQGIIGNKAMVFYIDFGNSSSVSLSDLRLIRKEVAAQHALAYSCDLDGVTPNSEDGTWSVPVLSIIHEMLVNSHCTIVVTDIDQDSSLLKVKVQKSEPIGWDLGTILVKEEYAIINGDLSLHYELSRTISNVLSTANCYSKNSPGDVGDTFNVIVTQVELPNLVYLQKLRQSEEDCFDFVPLTDIAELNKGIDAFEDMSDQINSSTALRCIELPSVGLMCLGQFTFDKRWYRAVCIEQYPDDDACLLVYIDYGNSEIISRERMRLLPVDYLSMPAMSFRSHINLIPPTGPNALWTKSSLDAVIESLGNKELVAKITQKAPLTVELWFEEDGDLNLAYKGAIEKGLAILPVQLSLVDDNRALEKCDVEVEEEEETAEEKDNDEM